MDDKLFALEAEGRTAHVGNALNSYCGVLSHWNNFNIRQVMLLKRHHFTQWGMFDYGLWHYYGQSPIIFSPPFHDNEKIVPLHP